MAISWTVLTELVAAIDNKVDALDGKVAAIQAALEVLAIEATSQEILGRIGHIPSGGSIRLRIEAHTVSYYFRGQVGTSVIMVTLDGVPVSGAAVTGDYYKPDNSPFLLDQVFTGIGFTGIYSHNFDIPSDADEGVYKLLVQAAYEIGGVSFDDEFSEPDGPAANWEVVSGDWAIESYLYRQTREDYVNTSVVSDPDAFNWADYAFQARVRWDSAKNGELGIYGRWLDGSHYYKLAFDPDWDSGKLVLRRGGSHLANADYPIAYPGTWYTLKLEFGGNNIRCCVNDELKIDFTDGVPIEKGKPGLYAGSIAASFDDVHVAVAGEEYTSYQVKDFKVEADLKVDVPVRASFRV